MGGVDERDDGSLEVKNQHCESLSSEFRLTIMDFFGHPRSFRVSNKQLTISDYFRTMF